MFRWHVMLLVLLAAASSNAGAASHGQIPIAGSSASPLEERPGDTTGNTDVALHRPSAPQAPVAVDLPASAPVTLENVWTWVRVYVDPSSAADEATLPIQGRYGLRGTTVLFYPAFPFEAAQSYRVEVTRAGEAPLQQVFTLPGGVTPHKPRVVRIFPSSPELPATTLRFYVQFSAPMRVQFRRGMVRLNDATGTELKDAFVNYGQELWSGDGMRLTLLLDPSRIKRGLTGLKEAGPLLHEGATVDLVVDVGNGTEISSPKSVVRRRFKVAPAVRRSLDTHEWRIHAPFAGSTRPYVVRFDRVMDRALLEDCVQVVDADGHSIKGHRVIKRAERGFQFWPSEPWKAHRYALVVNPELEDVSGNRLSEALDHEAGHRGPPDVLTEIPFTPVSYRVAREPALIGHH